MLISFTVENWMSYAKPATLSMVASRERQHIARVPSIAKYKVKVLPVAAIFGGNASGKTNLFKALQFAKTLVTKFNQPDNLIPIEPFLLDPATKGKPCRFNFELLIEEIIYEYSFSVGRNEVVEEKLVKISGKNEQTLFHRVAGEANFDASLANDLSLKFAFKGTRDNQLFVTNTVSQKNDQFRAVYDWFDKTLALVAPDTRFGPFERFFQEADPLFPAMNTSLADLDTGIDHLGKEMIRLENFPIEEEFRLKLEEEVKEGGTVRLVTGATNERYVISRENGSLVVYKLVAYHKSMDGNDVKMELRHESDGSQRVIDLMPAFFDMGNHVAGKVYVIDELDRSLHTQLTRKLLGYYLNTCTPATRTQLLFTTHDVMLMDQELLRRDEIWITERDSAGGTKLLSFSEYKDVRYDKDIRKSYLQGRLGGVPRIFIDSCTGDNTAIVTARG